MKNKCLIELQVEDYKRFCEEKQISPCRLESLQKYFEQGGEKNV